MKVNKKYQYVTFESEKKLPEVKHKMDECLNEYRKLATDLKEIMKRNGVKYE